MPVLTTWEGMEIPIPQGMDRHAAGHRLIRATEEAPFPAFRWKKGRLHAAEVVGCVQVGRLRVNVLPKLDTAEPDRDKEFLLNMLHAAGYLSRPHTGSAEVRPSFSDPLEAMISEVALEMLSALREGVPRRYERRQEDLSTIRGRIDFSSLSIRLPSERARLPMRHSPLITDNELAQCIKAIAQILYRLTRSSSNRQSLATVLGQFSGIGDRMPSYEQLDSVMLARRESHWEKSISVGRLLLAGQSPDPTFSGGSDAFSMLFPLQHLFERMMRKILGGAFQHSGIRASHRSAPLFLLEDPRDKSGIVRLKPDYLFDSAFGLVAVGDAKWKRATESGRAHGVKREDLYQVNAYLARYGVRNAFVFIPRANWMTPGWIKSYQIPETERHIHLVGVDIEGLINRDRKVRDSAFAVFSDPVLRILES
ncbi:McrC family protein [Luteimonas kalidii]|uniref:Restriction endonuclease n=1 Tax=Luteimonas kalidii TaxID=3042025 RepID=A0ABT6JYP3_9GAMM|nr:hypothetical protein [Luteimonas kalidii]MDH5835321.1 hypothetical protein [Luteimonas kalidii]